MKLIEKARMIHFHRHRQERFSVGTVEALGWKHVQSQQKRFEMLAAIGNLNGCEILDPGCGYGDLLLFLDRHFENIGYLGIELLPEYVKTAARRFAQRANTGFVIADFSKMALPAVDYALASGAFGYKSEDENYYFGTIRKLFETARKGIGFNMLDKEKFPSHPLLTGHDKRVVLAFCRSLSAKMKVIEDYLDDDFTVFVYR